MLAIGQTLHDGIRAHAKLFTVKEDRIEHKKRCKRKTTKEANEKRLQLLKERKDARSTKQAS